MFIINILHIITSNICYYMYIIDIIKIEINNLNLKYDYALKIIIQ